MDETETWDLINSVYCIGGTFEQWKATDEDAAQNALQAVKQLELGQMVVDLALESVWTALRREIVPVFWRTVCAPAAGESDTALLTRFHDALQLLQSSVVVLAPLINRCEEVCRECEVQYQGSVCSLQQQMMVQLRATLHSQMPAAAADTLEAVYAVAFRIFVQLELTDYKLSEDESSPDTGGACAGCGRRGTQCDCRTLMNTFQDINRVTWRVGVAYDLCSAVAAGQLVAAVRRRVAAACALPHDSHRLDSLLKWLEAAACGWLRVCVRAGSPPPDLSHPLYRACRRLLIHAFLRTRVNNLFAIVIDYPESRPAIEDVRTCLQSVDAHRHLVTTLRDSIQSRMLHPGVKTVDVLHGYISIIRALRLLEPRGVILDLVTEPVRNYLRSRRDFVRYVVTSLTDGGSLELSEDLTEGELDEQQQQQQQMQEGGEAAAEDEWRRWTPDTVYATDRTKKASSSNVSAGNDLISMLADIYGSKDTFISQYRALFADRLLSSLDCSKASVELETKHLEQIKKRFGTTSPYISKIEVMIRDMNFSRSVNTAVFERLTHPGGSGEEDGECVDQSSGGAEDKDAVAVACLIVSGLFWPAFKEESIQLPERVLGHLKEYDELFGKLKPNKKLSWKHHLGQVELDVDLGNRVLSMRVSPGQAAVAMLFEEKPRLTLQEVALETRTTPSTARKLITYWVGQGVLRETSPDVFEVCEDVEGGESSTPLTAPPPPPPTLPEEEEEVESAMAPSEMQREEELQVLWSYILGMLTNLDSLPLNRIHTMLRMFVEDSLECTQDELRLLLDQKVMQHKLVVVNGQYKLNKT